MEALIWILVIAAIIGAIVWNKRNAAAAMTGVEFHVPASPSEVSAAIHSAFRVGAGGMLRRFVAGVRLTGGGNLFRFESKIGDVGRVELSPNGGGTNVRAVTDELYVGSHPTTHSRGRGLWAMATAVTHGIYKMIGVTPGAVKMKRFQLGLEGRIAAQLRKAARSSSA
jgi:hypothetical protein